MRPNADMPPLRGLGAVLMVVSAKIPLLRSMGVVALQVLDCARCCAAFQRQRRGIFVVHAPKTMRQLRQERHRVGRGGWLQVSFSAGDEDAAPPRLWGSFGS